MEVVECKALSDFTSLSKHMTVSGRGDLIDVAFAEAAVICKHSHLSVFYLRVFRWPSTSRVASLF